MWKRHTFYLLTLCAIGLFTPAARAQAPAQPQAKDQQEYDLATNSQKEADPNKRLQILDEWKQKYPETQLKLARAKLYMQTYQQANQPAKAIDAAREVLTIDANDFFAHLTLASLAVNSADQKLLADAEKSAQDLLKATKPDVVTDAQWPELQKTGQFLAHQALAWSGLQKKQNDVAETESIKALEINPNAPQISYWLATAALGQKDPNKYVLALFSFARSVAFNGPGALSPQGKQQIDALLTKYYKTYHGSEEGLADLKKVAANQPLPPPDFKIKTSAEIAAEKDEQLRKENPKLALFLAIKEGLTGADSAGFWNEMKGKGIQLRGTVVSAKPATRPKVVELAVSQTQTAEITLTNVETSARCQLNPGAQVDFDEAVATEFTPDPFMIKMDGGKITSGCVDAPPPARGGGTKKGGTKKK